MDIKSLWGDKVPLSALVLVVGNVAATYIFGSQMLLWPVQKNILFGLVSLATSSLATLLLYKKNKEFSMSTIFVAFLALSDAVSLVGYVYIWFAY
jgi:hypothetical protein